ncbi:MAG: glucose-6-phosphate dehydrogenase assembly protein OpcA [Rhabdochlamydiaceae bacterium]
MNLTSELNKIWQQLEGAGTMRASLFNLIVVAPDNARREYVRKITNNVMIRFPCRVIFITILELIKEIKANVCATTGIGGNPEIACDMIEIATPSSLLSKIPFLILPHFLPDLPIYLLWAESPTAHPSLFKELQKWSTRLIYDSEVSDNLSSFCQTLTLQSKDREIADLNWARTESWRELLAATFYSPARIASLQSAKKVEIHYNDFETPFFCHTKIQALYLQAWLTSCLNWSPTISLLPQTNKELAPGTVLSMEILCEDQAHFTFSRDPDHPHQVRTIICDENTCEIPSRFIFSKAQSGLSLVNLIYHADSSSHFLQVLRFLSTQNKL